MERLGFSQGANSVRGPLATTVQLLEIVRTGQFSPPQSQLDEEFSICLPFYKVSDIITIFQVTCVLHRKIDLAVEPFLCIFFFLQINWPSFYVVYYVLLLKSYQISRKHHVFWMTFYKPISWSECQTGGYQLFKNISLTWVPVRNRCSGPACHSCCGGPGNARNQLPLHKCADPVRTTVSDSRETG